jgi:hypothetical protein
VISLRAFCLALAALTAGTAGRATAQINISIGGRPRMYNPYSHLGTVGWYRPPPPIYRTPAFGVVVPPPVYRPVPPMIGLRPTFYPAAYTNLLTPGYQTIVANNVPYYYYPALPLGATFVQVGEAQYYRAGGLWYQPYPTAGGNIFLVVPPPL